MEKVTVLGDRATNGKVLVTLYGVMNAIGGCLSAYTSQHDAAEALHRHAASIVHLDALCAGNGQPVSKPEDYILSIGKIFLWVDTPPKEDQA